MALQLWTMGDNVIRDEENILYCEDCPCIEEGCTANFAYEIDEEDCHTVHFYDQTVARNSPIGRWLWTFGDGESSSEQNPTHTYEDKGPYTVNLLVILEDSQNCTKQRVIELCGAVEVFACAPILFPYAFQVELTGYVDIGPNQGEFTRNTCSTFNDTYELHRVWLGQRTDFITTTWTGVYVVDFPWKSVNNVEVIKCDPTYFGAVPFIVTNQMVINIEVGLWTEHICTIDFSVDFRNWGHGSKPVCDDPNRSPNIWPVYYGPRPPNQTYVSAAIAFGYTRRLYYDLTGPVPPWWRTALTSYRNEPVAGHNGTGSWNVDYAWYGPATTTDFGGQGVEHPSTQDCYPYNRSNPGYKAFVTAL